MNDGVDEAPVERLLKAHEVAEMLGVTPRVVVDRFKRGDLPGYRLWGSERGSLRFRLSDIEAMLESWRSGKS
jgi:predicted DNA-binding transcriptional regulator AlpA